MAASEAICEFDGAYLLKLDTTGEDVGAALFIDEQIEIWIGLNDTDQNGAYVWLDGTPPSFTRWSNPPSATSPNA